MKAEIKVPLILFSILSFITWSLYLGKTLNENKDSSEKTRNMLRIYWMIGFLSSSILIQVFVHKFLRVIKLRFPALYHEKRRQILIYSILLSIALFGRGASFVVSTIEIFYRRKAPVSYLNFYYNIVAFYIEGIPTAFIVFVFWRISYNIQNGASLSPINSDK